MSFNIAPLITLINYYIYSCIKPTEGYLYITPLICLYKQKLVVNQNLYNKLLTNQKRTTTSYLTIFFYHYKQVINQSQRLITNYQPIR